MDSCSVLLYFLLFVFFYWVYFVEEEEEEIRSELGEVNREDGFDQNISNSQKIQIF